MIAIFFILIHYEIVFLILFLYALKYPYKFNTVGFINISVVGLLYDANLDFPVLQTSYIPSQLGWKTHYLVTLTI